MASARRSRIYVIVGVNGAGKSSIGGGAFRELGADYYNPTKQRAACWAATPPFPKGTPIAQPGIKASGCSAAPLRAKISPLRPLLAPTRSRACYKKPQHKGIEIFVWYAGLASVQLHIDRVAARVRRGSHAIARDLIEHRFEQSRINLIELMPYLTELRVYDNSVDADPAAGKTPEPKLLLHMKRGAILNLHELKNTPDWAKPIVSKALKLHKARR